MRLIDADALLSEFLRRYTERERNRELVFAACEIKQDFADMVTDAPTIDAEPVTHGRWVDDPNIWRCDQCLEWLDILQGTADMNYCPHCGAYMRGETE